MAQVFMNAQPLTSSQRVVLKIARVFLFVAGCLSVAFVGTPGPTADSAASGAGAQLLNHLGYAAVLMLYPMTWASGMLMAYVLVALHTMSCVAMLRLNGARPRRSGTHITVLGVEFSRSRYLMIIAMPILLCFLVAFGLLAVMPEKLPIKFIPFPFITQGAIAFGMGVYLGGCAENLKTFLQVLRIPHDARIADRVRGFSYEVPE